MGSTISRPDGLQSQLLCHVLAVRLWTSHLTSLCLRFLFSPMGMPKYLDNRRSLMHRCTNVAQKGAWHMVHAQGNGCSEICSRPSMAPHSSTLAWKIPWLEEHGRLQFMGSLRVGTQLSDFTFTFHFHALEKEMATHSSGPAWRTPGMGEPGGLPSMGSHRVGHD